MTTQRRENRSRHHQWDFWKFTELCVGSVGESGPLNRTEAEARAFYEHHRDRFVDDLEGHRLPFAVLWFEPDLAPGIDLDTEYPKQGDPLPEAPGWHHGSLRLDETWSRNQ